MEDTFAQAGDKAGKSTGISKRIFKGRAGQGWEENDGGYHQNGSKTEAVHSESRPRKQQQKTKRATTRCWLADQGSLSMKLLCYLQFLQV